MKTFFLDQFGRCWRCCVGRSCTAQLGLHGFQESQRPSLCQRRVVLSHRYVPLLSYDTHICRERSSHLCSPLLLQASQVASEDVAAACAQAVQAATAGCNIRQQALICQTACQQLTQCCQQLQSPTSPPDPNHADPHSGPAQTNDFMQTHGAESIQCQVQPANESRQALTTAMDIPSGDSMLPGLHSGQQMSQLLAQSGLVSAAAVTALSPGVLPGPQMKAVLDCLIRLAMGVSQNSIQQAAMTVAAALVNKWPAGMLPLLHDCRLSEHLQ